MILLCLTALISFYTSTICFIALFRSGSQKTGTAPDNDVLIRFIFGEKYVTSINNLKGGIIWLLGGVVCTVLILRKLNNV
jgi:hypothetical protein